MKKRQKKKNTKKLRNERFERLRNISKEIGNFIESTIIDFDASQKEMGDKLDLKIYFYQT